MSDIWFLNLFIEPLVFWLCSSSTNRLITSKDHASVQLNVGHVDENGVYTGQFTTFALCGFVRAQVTSYSPCLLYLVLSVACLCVLGDMRSTHWPGENIFAGSIAYFSMPRVSSFYWIVYIFTMRLGQEHSGQSICQISNPISGSITPSQIEPVLCLIRLT